MQGPWSLLCFRDGVIWPGQPGPFPLSQRGFSPGIRGTDKKECRLHTHGQPVTPAQGGLFGSQTSAKAYKLLFPVLWGKSCGGYSHIKHNPITLCQNTSWKDPLFPNLRAHKLYGDDTMTDTHICWDRSWLICFFSRSGTLSTHSMVCG